METLINYFIDNLNLVPFLKTKTKKKKTTEKKYHYFNMIFILFFEIFETNSNGTPNI